jgi:tRNA-dihydrouridine synthase 1
VKALVESVDIPIISNGNVRTWDDVLRNQDFTGASGIMVGETLLGNP